MSMFPIVPIWIMLPICAILIFMVIKNKIHIIRRIIIITLLFIINMRIMIHSGENTKTLASNLDVLFVIDNTISMIAEDYNENTPRLTAVKKDCNYIMNELAGAKFSLITFANNAQIVTPFTRDTNMTLSAIKMIHVENEYYAKGSTPNIVIDSLNQQLKSSKSKDNRKRIVFFISDGEITKESQMASFSDMNKDIDSGAVLGYGTTKGGYMRIYDIYGNLSGYVEDRTSTQFPLPKAISKIDETNLKTIAKDLGIDYINMSKQSNISNKIKEIKQNYEEFYNENERSYYNDIYYVFALPLLVLLILEFLKYKKKI